MASYFDDAVVDEDEDICGWGTVDFDDNFLDRGRRKAASKAIVKPKQRPQKTFSDSNPGPEIPIQQKQWRHRPPGVATLVEKRIRIANQVESSTENQSPDRKPKRKSTHEIQKPPIPKPPPKTSSILEENAAIAALGRQRRMKVVAAAMAANVSRRPGVAAVVSASFDYDSEDDHEEPETPPRYQTDRVIPYPKPEKQQNKLPHAVAPPAAPVEVVKKIQPPVPLPLLSINPNCGGSETRLSGRKKSTLKSPRNKRRHRQPKGSLLPSQDVSENWESNFRPSLRRFRSPREYQATGPTEESTKFTSSSFKGDFQQVQDATGRRKDILLPSIHHTTKDSCTATATSVDISRSNSEASDQSMRDEEEDESWTRGYEDPEVAAISMAGLIQALSTFGKQKKPHKSGKRKKRRAKQQTLVLNQQTPLNLPLLPSEKMNVTSSIEEQQDAEPRCRRRKHRKKLSE
ncbi:hypothetical protein P3T76_011137 [Phytophthora citrophthora]|uniref:Uncharacterized protein n=1 Tax=Phytophthora citrophthora TaxID=4793 RepID=A0AAD9G9V2_9STRA|nr:hypothetical protein P3T76_011137 [Phytophthora citrophthora]